MANRGWTWILAVAGAIASVLVVVLALRVRDLTDEVRRLRFERNLPQIGDLVADVRIAVLGADSVALGRGGAAARQVWFVFNTTCPICAASLADWNAAAAQLRADSTVLVLGISLDPAAVTQSYVREHQVIFPVALLDGVTAASLYRIRGVPLTIVVDQTARIRLVRPGRFTAAGADSLLQFLAADSAAGEVVQDGREIELPAGRGPRPHQEVDMSKLLDRIVRVAFILGVVGAIGFGAGTALAANQTLDCICDPDDPDRDEFCEECCMAMGSMCPLGGSEPRECLCA